MAVEDLRKDEMMAHLLDSLDEGKDIGHYGHHSDDDSLRHWVHWLQSEDSRVLYDPMIGHRREAEWDDRLRHDA